MSRSVVVYISKFDWDRVMSGEIKIEQAHIHSQVKEGHEDKYYKIHMQEKESLSEERIVDFVDLGH